MRTKKRISAFIFLMLFQVSLISCGQVKGTAGGQGEGPCTTADRTWYFGVEIGGMPCGYCVSKECTGVRDGKPVMWESNEILIRLSILGEGMDIRIRHIYGSDPGSGRLMINETNILSGNTSIMSSTKIVGDTAFYSGNNNPLPKKIFLPRDVVLETSLKSPHLFRDFATTGAGEKKYRVYDPVRGLISEKGYIRKGEEEITLNNKVFQAIVLEETDYSTGTRAMVWLNKTDGMTIKTLVAGRDIFLTDSKITERIHKVNYDNLIFARVNKVIPDFQKVNYMKVKAKIESYGEMLTVEGLNFPGQKFTGTVTDNLVEGIFELEPVKYEGANAPSLPPDLLKYPGFEQYIEPEMAIESNDPLLIAEAKRITVGSKDSWEAAKRLSHWVAHNIEGAIPGGGSAINAFKMRQGECGGHSRLLAAFCRAVKIPARIAVGCMYSTHYGGSFGQHAWTEVHMGEAGWIPVDATVFETDFVDAGHIRLGERSSFQPKEMEILEYRTVNEKQASAESIKPLYKASIGKYTDLEKNRVFSIRYQDNGLAIDIPNQMTLQLEEPDSASQWYPKLTRQISISFRRDPSGKVEKLAIRQRLGMPKLSGQDSIPADVPADMKKYLGVYSLPRGATRGLTFSDGCLVMVDPVGKSQEFMKYSKDGETWKEKTGMFEFFFESDENNEVTRMILFITSLYPKGEPAADVIEPVILELGAEAGLKKYKDLREDGSGQYFFTEGLINALGYRLLTKDKTADAIGVFKFNAQEYPDSFNVYDSLGEAYYKNGNTDLAIANFERSVALNPKNENGKKMLEKIRSEK